MFGLLPNRGAYQDVRPRTQNTAQNVLARVRLLVLAAVPVALAGCGTVAPPDADSAPASAIGQNDPAFLANRPALPPPDTDRMGYDEKSRTLSLYDLPGNDRWMVRLAGEPTGRPVAATSRVPTDRDLSDVLVYYTRPGVKPSVPVTVKQIREGGNPHSSLAMR
ncbi:MAG: hypothetical protein K2V38_03185 [Gemmataceae bacterium]|nr:hypothetical protein [Gemmataceae bacterium]